MEENNRNFEPEMEIDIKELIEKVLNHKWLIISITFLFVLTAGILSFFVLPPVYEAGTTIMVTQGDRKVQTSSQSGNIEGVVDNLYSLPVMTINTYIRQITTQEVLDATVKELGLKDLGYSGGTLRSMISAVAVKDTNLIEIKVKNTNPLLAQDIANEVSRQTVIFVSDNNQSQLAKSIVFLDDQIGKVQEELSGLRKEMNQLEQQSRNSQYLLAERDSKTKDLINFKSQLSQTQVEYNQALQGKQSLESRLNSTNPEAPDYQEIRIQLVNQTTRAAELEGKMSSLRSVIGTLDKEVADLQKEYSEKNQEYEALRNKLDSLENTESVLVDKRLQTQITQSVNLGETSLQMISKATQPTSPISPKKMMNMAIAGVLGLMISVVLVFLLEILDNTVKTPEDVAKHLGLPVLGAIPAYRDLKPEKGDDQDEETI